MFKIKGSSEPRSQIDALDKAGLSRDETKFPNQLLLLPKNHINSMLYSSFVGTPDYPSGIPDMHTIHDPMISVS
jgi:hypothetical protein